MPPVEFATAVRRHWWLFLVRGLAAVAFGALTLRSPGATLIVLVAFFAADALVGGSSPPSTRSGCGRSAAGDCSSSTGWSA